jgi:hypothetical protein
VWRGRGLERTDVEAEMGLGGLILGGIVEGLIER